MKKIILAVALILSAGSAQATLFHFEGEVTATNTNIPVGTEVGFTLFHNYNTDPPPYHVEGSYAIVDLAGRVDTASLWEASSKYMHGIGNYWYFNFIFDQIHNVGNRAMTDQEVGSITTGTLELLYHYPDTGFDELITADVWRVQPDSSPVPEPSTMLLFGSGLVGLASAARKKKA